MKTIDIRTGAPYQVLVGRDILKSAGVKILEIKSYKKIAVITDDIVYKLHGKTLKESLNLSGLSYEFFVFPNGEASKCQDTLNRIYEFLTLSGISRSDLIVAFGGGVVGDMAGFAASTYLRGVDYIQIPTTLIAQTDSSVGGKTAIDTPLGKNLVGAFYQPKLVLCDVDLLSTLPDSVFNAAMAEVIKYALLTESDLFSVLENKSIQDCLEDVVNRCIQIKADVVAGDEFDKGNRMTLQGMAITEEHIYHNHFPATKNMPNNWANPITPTFSVPEQGVALYIDLDTYTMTVYKDGKEYKTYPVSGGKTSTPSPLGTC